MIKKQLQVPLVFNVFDELGSPNSDYMPDFRDLSELEDFHLDRHYLEKLRPRIVPITDDRYKQVIISYPVFNKKRKSRSKKSAKKAKLQHKIKLEEVKRQYAKTENLVKLPFASRGIANTKLENQMEDYSFVKKDISTLITLIKKVQQEYNTSNAERDSQANQTEAQNYCSINKVKKEQVEPASKSLLSTFLINKEHKSSIRKAQAKLAMNFKANTVRGRSSVTKHFSVNQSVKKETPAQKK